MPIFKHAVFFIVISSVLTKLTHIVSSLFSFFSPYIFYVRIICYFVAEKINSLLYTTGITTNILLIRNNTDAASSSPNSFWHCF